MSDIYFTSEFSYNSAISVARARKEALLVVSRLSSSGGTSEEVFSSRYKVHGAGIDLYDIGKIIENDLAERDQCIGEYKIEVGGYTSDTGSSMYALYSLEGTFIHCSRKMTQPAAQYLAEHFLTPPENIGAAIRLPLGFALEYMARIDTSTAARVYYRCRRLVDGENLPTTRLESSSLAPVSGLSAFPVYDVRWSTDSPAYYSADSGSRHMSLLMKEEHGEHDVLFRFRNCFNMWDYVWLRGVTECAPKADSQEVRVNGLRRRVDIRRAEEHTITVDGLTKQEAARAAEMLYAREVCIMNSLTDDDDCEPVIITDISGPISDSVSELVSLKISYKS